MNRIAIAVVVALVAGPALAGCASHQAACPQDPTAASTSGEKMQITGKMEAPVQVAAQVTQGTARVSVQFGADATDVRVNVRGVDGLQVTSPQDLAQGASFKKGDVATYDVSFVPGPGQSNLAVTVTGTFNGISQAAARSFAIGTPGPEKQGPGHVVEDSDGQRIKELPADTR